MSTLSVQALATVAMTAPSVLATAIAPQLGLPPQRIGWFVGIAYFAAMFSGLVAGAWVGRTGPIRMSQWALLSSTLGLLLAASAALPGALPILLVLPIAAIALGVAYGLPNPAASLILSRHAPPARRGLFFSIKQTGVPIGVGLSGLLAPALLTVMPWPAVFATLAAVTLVLAIGLQSALGLDAPERANAQASRGANTPHRQVRPSLLAQLIGPLKEVLRNRDVRLLGLTSMTYSMTQLCFITFLVSYLKLEHGMSLIAAAGVLSASQVASVAFRVVWGQVSDRWVHPTLLLGALGVSMGVCTALLGLLPADSPTLLRTLVALLCASTCMSWNGVYFADLARRVPPATLAHVTGGTQFLTFCGAMVGPVLFATLVGWLGSHGAAYLTIAAAPALIGAWLIIGALRPASRARSPGRS